MTATVTLRPMTEPEYAEFTERAVAEYAEDKVRSGEFPADRAAEMSRAEFERLLPAGRVSPGNLLFTAFDGAEQVGLVWLALPTVTRRQAWVFELWVAPDHRRKGYGRAIMLGAERELAALDVAELGLNVFGHNPGATRLYESLGYTVLTQQMAKPIVADGK